MIKHLSGTQFIEFFAQYFDLHRKSDNIRLHSAVLAIPMLSFRDFGVKRIALTPLLSLMDIK
ncbi:MAG: hypothetical protein K0R08_1260 [Solimicrobium sp.]|jgi:hypothetical protein|nr:hypothetical protein [Solimicrobium sp.]